ncbi:hypothetical protein E8E14_002564 [Neopestalotiopsis sp. 37M]|nr:hypothetical protein E8E14_002564 [Neopestalotiopsis sp. 37M]
MSPIAKLRRAYMIHPMRPIYSDGGKSAFTLDWTMLHTRRAKRTIGNQLHDITVDTVLHLRWTLCVICSIIQQIYHYAYVNNNFFLYYADIAWEQLAYIKANYPNAEVIFKNGNYGFLLVMSNIRKLIAETIWIEKLRSLQIIRQDDPEVQDHVPSSLFDKNWLVFRLSFAIILISGFILATVLVHLPTPSVMGHQTTTSEPDLGVAQAKTSIIGYIYGVTPGLAIPIVFGLTRPFRQTLYKTFVPKRWQEKNTAQQKPRASAIMGHHVLAVGPGAPTVGSQQRGMVGNVAALGQQTHEGGSYARLEGSYEMGATKSGDGPSWLYAGTDDAIKLGSSGSTASFHPLIQHRN